MLDSLTLMSVTLVVLRVLLTPLALYNVSWSAMGFLSLLRGKNFPTSIYQSVVFASSVGILGFQLLALAGVKRNEDPAITLALLCTFFLANILSAFGRRYHTVMNFESFYWLFHNDNLDIAIRAAKLNETDPKFTEGLITHAETQVAVEIVRRTMNKKAGE